MYVMVAVEAGDIYYPPAYNIDEVPGWSLKPAWLNPSLCNATEGVREDV